MLFVTLLSAISNVPAIVLCSVGVGIAAVLICVMGCIVSMRFVRFGQLPTPAPASSAYFTSFLSKLTLTSWHCSSVPAWTQIKADQSVRAELFLKVPECLGACWSAQDSSIFNLHM